jgi:hypothetical protein
VADGTEATLAGALALFGTVANLIVSSNSTSDPLETCVHDRNSLVTSMIVAVGEVIGESYPLYVYIFSLSSPCTDD